MAGVSFDEVVAYLVRQLQQGKDISLPAENYRRSFGFNAQQLADAARQQFQAQLGKAK